jgi:hypothetical protein
MNKKQEITTSVTKEQAPQVGKRPTHIAYWVKERENAKAHWREIGAAWTHADGKGISINLDLQPLDGRITLRVAEDKKE